MYRRGSESSPLLRVAAIPNNSDEIENRREDDEDVDDKMNKFKVNNADGESGKKLPQFIAALAATGGALAAGTVLGWTSPADTLKNNGTNVREPQYDFTISDEEFSWIGSMVTLGACFVCIPIGLLMNAIGRKWTMLLLVIPFTVGWILVIWATSVIMMCIGRFLLGIAGGAFCVTAPMYIGEIAQSSIRGTVGTFFQLMITIGILFVYVVGTFTSVYTLSLICGVIPLIFGAVFFFMPESPAYLVSKDKTEDAVKALKWLRGQQYDEKAELEEMKKEDAQMKAEKLTFSQAFSRAAAIRGLVISLGLMFFQQMSGINAVIFYTVFIFNEAKTPLGDNEATIIVGVIQVGATLLSSLVMDKLGRRILLLMSAIVMAVSSILIGIYFFLSSEGKDVDSINWLPIVALCLFIIFFSLGFGPVPWLMVGELFPPNVKNFSGSLSGTFNWILAFVITKTFASLSAAMGIGPVFWLFAALTVIGAIFVFLFVPETKGKSLAEIQRMLSRERQQ